MALTTFIAYTNNNNRFTTLTHKPQRQTNTNSDESLFDCECVRFSLMWIRGERIEWQIPPNPSTQIHARARIHRIDICVVRFSCTITANVNGF